MKQWLAVFLLALCTGVQANIGKITELQGTAVEIKRGSQTIKANKDTVIEANDTVSVGSNTKLTITFADNSTAKITENSKLVIDDFVYDPKGNSKSAMRVTLGTVRMASGGIAKQNTQNVNIKTPTAAIAVRGTDFAMTVSELGESTVVLLPTCPDDKFLQRAELPQNCTCGAIDVSTGAGKVSMDSPFYATYVVSAQDAPLPPVRVDPSIVNASSEGSLNKPQAIVAAVSEQQEKKDSAKDGSKTNSDEQRAARNSSKENTANKTADSQGSQQAVIQTSKTEIIEVKTATAETAEVNPCWPFTTCGNEKGFNWYEHADASKGNMIHIRTSDLTDNTTYNISVNSVDISTKIVGNGTNVVTIRQTNR